MGTTVLYHDRLAFWGVSFNLIKYEREVNRLLLVKKGKHSRRSFLIERKTFSSNRFVAPTMFATQRVLDIVARWVSNRRDLYPRVLSQFNKILLRVLFTAVPCVLCHNCQVVGTGPNKTSHHWRTKTGLTAILYFKQSNQTHTIFCDTFCNARVTQTEKNKHCVWFISSPKV